MKLLVCNETVGEQIVVKGNRKNDVVAHGMKIRSPMQNFHY